MKIITFEIRGNQTNPFGNPVGYTRTLSHSWRADATKYANWCRFVRQCYFLEFQKELTAREMLSMPQPLTTSKESHAEMHIEVEYSNDTRPDMDNVFKGIADALFKNDKYIMAGSFKGKMSDNKKGRVLVKIILHGEHGG